jgi:hypothetical protein
MHFRVRAAVLVGVRRRDRKLRDIMAYPRPRFEGCARRHSGKEATWANHIVCFCGNLFRKESQGFNEARKPCCPAPHSFFRRDCKLPAMFWLTGSYARWKKAPCGIECLVDRTRWYHLFCGKRNRRGSKCLAL